MDLLPILVLTLVQSFGANVLAFVLNAVVVNHFDDKMNFSCPPNTAISNIHSYHSNHYEDRIWTINCQPTDGPVGDCHWSGYQNEYDKPVSFHCGENELINGMESIHSNHNEDRKWSFQCCKMHGYHEENCRFTGFLNDFDDPLTYNVPSHHALVGAVSIHNNDHEDRIFDFEVCSFVAM